MSEKFYFFEFCNGETVEQKKFNTLEEAKEYITKNHICTDEIQVFKGRDITEEVIKWKKNITF